MFLRSWRKKLSWWRTFILLWLRVSNKNSTNLLWVFLGDFFMNFKRCSRRGFQTFLECHPENLGKWCMFFSDRLKPQTRKRFLIFPSITLKKNFSTSNLPTLEVEIPFSKNDWKIRWWIGYFQHEKTVFWNLQAEKVKMTEVFSNESSLLRGWYFSCLSFHTSGRFACLFCGKGIQFLRSRSKCLWLSTMMLSFLNSKNSQRSKISFRVRHLLDFSEMSKHSVNKKLLWIWFEKTKQSLLLCWHNF